MENAKKEMEQIKFLEADLEKSKQQEQMYAEAIENLQSEYDTLEAENNELKKEANKREEKRQSMLKKANFDLFTTTAEEENHVAEEYYELLNQLELSKASIRYLRAENVHLKSQYHQELLSVAPATEITKERERLNAIGRETKLLMKDMRVASASPRVVKLGQQNNKKKTSLDYQYQTQQSVLYTLQQRSIQLRNKLNDIQMTVTPIVNNNNKVKKKKSFFFSFMLIISS